MPPAGDQSMEVRDDMTAVPASVALAGSGEFLPAMEQVDRELLRGRPPRAAVLPTAASLEGDDRVAYWLDLASRHYRSMGVEAVPVPVVTRTEAEDPAMASLLDGVGLVYLSGGDPHHLSATLRDSAVWLAVLEAVRSGAALAGCSAGAMALTAGAPVLRNRRFAAGTATTTGAVTEVADGVANGLGVVPALAVMPHFEVMERWEGAVERFISWHPAGTTLVGIDEETALVGDGSSFVVAGRGAVWVLDQEGRRRLGTGERLEVG